MLPHNHVIVAILNRSPFGATRRPHRFRILQATDIRVVLEGLGCEALWMELAVHQAFVLQRASIWLGSRDFSA